MYLYARLALCLVMSSHENADAVLLALSRFGAPLHNLTKDDLFKDGTFLQGHSGDTIINVILSCLPTDLLNYAWPRFAPSGCEP
jgi:hypothetical protein